jgi:hypothetical protein
VLVIQYVSRRNDGVRSKSKDRKNVVFFIPSVSIQFIVKDGPKHAWASFIDGNRRARQKYSFCALLIALIV